MLRCRKFLISIICLSIFASTISSYAEEEIKKCSYAEEEIEDLIDIAESKSKIIAIIEGRKTVTFDLRPNEKVLWSGSNGYLGAFLTDLHFFVISTSLNAWQALPLRLDESGTGVASLSEYIALLVTKDHLNIHEILDKLILVKYMKTVLAWLCSQQLFTVSGEEPCCDVESFL